MGELLTSLDVVNKAFKKTMRGYDPAEVDEFLDRVAESIQAYVQRVKDYERFSEEQGEKLRDYDNIKSSLHEALLMAQRTAEEKVNNAVKFADEKIADASRVADERINDAAARADDIVAEAKIKADRMIQSAENEVAEMASELAKLNELRAAGFSHLRTFIADVTGVVNNASTGDIQIPDFARTIIARRSEQSAGEQYQPIQASAQPASNFLPYQPEVPPVEEVPRRIELSDTLNALGIDPNLLNSEIR